MPTAALLDARRPGPARLDELLRRAHLVGEHRRDAAGGDHPRDARPARRRHRPRRRWQCDRRVQGGGAVAHRPDRPPAERGGRPGLDPAGARRAPRQRDHRRAGRVARAGRARRLAAGARRRGAGPPVPRRADHGARAVARRVARPARRVRGAGLPAPRRRVPRRRDPQGVRGRRHRLADGGAARPVRGRHEHRAPRVGAGPAGRVRRGGRPARAGRSSSTPSAIVASGWRSTRTSTRRE